MKQLVEITSNKSKLLRLQYDLGNMCNYKCWYCFPNANTGTVSFPDVDIVKVNIVKLINYYLESKIVDEVELTLMGGEPTLWPKLGKFVEYISQNTKCTISMLTNGSRTLRWWNQFGHYFNKVSISVHHERADIAHIDTIAGVLIEKKVSVIAMVLMDHTAWDKCKDLVNQLIKTKNKFMILAKPININGKTFYNDEQKKFLKESRKRLPSLKIILQSLTKFSKIPIIKANFNNKEKVKITADSYFIINNLNNFKDWKCSLGINFIYIHRNGIISGTCLQKLYGLDYYYNINDTDFVEKFNPIITTVVCEQQSCFCSSETILAKKKI
jgi:MoaA/NifB/PqqE/SkfB family radical SAM enzyme